jgi:hypothetical protein
MSGAARLRADVGELLRRASRGRRFARKALSRKDP